MAECSVSRHVVVPDKLRVARYKAAAELGPKILFFSGGTALKPVSKKLVEYTHNSIHLITPFDSGGSSAKLRKAFKMLAVGDLRNRVMALADDGIRGAPEVYALFAYRLPKDQPPQDLLDELESLIRGKHPLIRAVPDPMRKIIRTHLRFFADMKSDSFDLRGASIGNLILAGGYFNYDRKIDPVLFLFSKLVEARGEVRPIVNKDLTLTARLADGQVLSGQHRLTGKEGSPIASKVEQLWLAENESDPSPVEVDIRSKTKQLINKAELVVFPLGSFYSSVVANLLPQGVGHAVAKAQCPKVFTPNVAGDPEMLGLSVAEATQRLLGVLRRTAGPSLPTSSFLNFVLVDNAGAEYHEPLGHQSLSEAGINLIKAPLSTPESRPFLDPTLYIEALLSLI